MERPFIIYTLRRTGGTSLTTFMARISRFPSVEHEPFNKDRRWAAVSTAVEGGISSDALRDRLRELLTERPNIKHAVEVVPMPIARALIDVCQELGYSQFVLHRRAEKDRLMSLFMAQATGAWGPGEAAIRYPLLRSGELAPNPINIARVPERVRMDAACLGETLMTLRGRGIDFGWLLFEEIYANPAATVQAALAIAARMGLNLTETDERLSVFSSSSGQGTSEAMALVPQAAEVKAVLDRLLG
jgi:hypothetical protein